MAVAGFTERLLLEEVAFKDSINASRSSTAPPVEGVLYSLIEGIKYDRYFGLKVTKFRIHSTYNDIRCEFDYLC